MTAFDFFDKIFYINLDRRDDRREHVENEFDKIHVLDKVERVPGYGIPGDSAGGCFLSHAKCVQIAKSRRYRNILIFEDDISFINHDIITDTIINSTRDLIDVDPTWDLFYIGGDLCGKSRLVTENLIKVNKMWCTQGYAINHTCYDKILRSRKVKFDFQNKTVRAKRRAFRGADLYMVRIIQNYWGKCYGTSIPLCVQSDFHSDIAGWKKPRKDLQLKLYKENIIRSND